MRRWDDGDGGGESHNLLAVEVVLNEKFIGIIVVKSHPVSSLAIVWAISLPFELCYENGFSLLKIHRKFNCS